MVWMKPDITPNAKTRGEIIEQVLCIQRNTLPQAWVKERSVVPMNLETFTRACIDSGFEFIDRSLAEENPKKKQIIPYILLQSADGQLTAAYNRKGSEARLHDLWSVGIGGHINPEDQSGQPEEFNEILMAGLTRELDEELTERPDGDQLEFLGVISEDITPVGSVHLGAVFRIQTHTPSAYAPGPELYRFQWMETDSLSGLTLELWSELALELLARVSGSGA